KERSPPQSEYYKCAKLQDKFFVTEIKENGLTII
ncbi:hypothetical protein DBR06_SOUSAS7610068, partial [Sousa chinensis]